MRLISSAGICRKTTNGRNTSRVGRNLESQDGAVTLRRPFFIKMREHRHLKIQRHKIFCQASRCPGSASGLRHQIAICILAGWIMDQVTALPTSAWVAISPACSAEEWPLVAPAASWISIGALRQADHLGARLRIAGIGHDLPASSNSKRSPTVGSRCRTGEEKIRKSGQSRTGVISCDGRR